MTRCKIVCELKKNWKKICFCRLIFRVKRTKDKYWNKTIKTFSNAKETSLYQSIEATFICLDKKERREQKTKEKFRVQHCEFQQQKENFQHLKQTYTRTRHTSFASFHFWLFKYQKFFFFFSSARSCVYAYWMKPFGSTID